MSAFTLLPVVKVEDINLMYVDSLPFFYRGFYLTCVYSRSSLGGFIMFIIGVAYLVYEGKSSRSPQPATALEARKSENAWSRAILGVQVFFLAPPQ
jgi:hypothetical protein